MPRVSAGAEGEGRWRDSLLLALTWAAGYVDALGFLALGGVFTANMTGNTVLLGLHVSLEQGAAVLRSLVALGGFGAGLLIGAVIVERGHGNAAWPRAVNWALAVEAGALGGFALGWHVAGAGEKAAALHGLILLLAVAMGIQSAAVRRLNVPGIATTYMTGTLTSAVTGFVASRRASARPAVAPRAPAATRWGRGVKLQLLSLVVYGVGAMIGGFAQSRGRGLAAIWPLLIVLAVVALASRVSPDGRD